MRIGILTFHDGINYGAFFQVLALKSFLEKEGYECEVINYKSLGFTLREYRCFLNPLSVPISNIIKNIIKISRFKSAHKELNLTKRIFNPDRLKDLKFDSIVIGSDEVWNFGTSLIGYDPVYFSKGLNANRIISYAASFGNIKPDMDISSELKSFLKKINNISVRDENSARIIERIVNKPVLTVLDPIFLYPINNKALSASEKGFILIYGYHFPEKTIRQILKYARSSGKKLISVGYHLPWCDISLDTLNPFEWLGYFSVCDYVITAMYHGMLFSILNNKEFCMIATPYRKNKVGKLLSELGLSGRIIEEAGSVEKTFDSSIDYIQVNSRVEELRNVSRNFLLEALKN